MDRRHDPYTPAVSRPRREVHVDLRLEPIWSPRRGVVDFTVPQFAEYIARNHPIEPTAG